MTSSSWAMQRGDSGQLGREDEPSSDNQRSSVPAYQPLTSYQPQIPSRAQSTAYALPPYVQPQIPLRAQSSPYTLSQPQSQLPQPSYSLSTNSQLQYALPPPPTQSYSQPLNLQQPNPPAQQVGDPIQRPPTPFNAPYQSYQTSSDEKQALPYPQSYNTALPHDSRSSALGAAPTQATEAPQYNLYSETPYLSLPHPQFTSQQPPQTTPYSRTSNQQPQPEPEKSPESKNQGDVLAKVSVHDGEEPQSFTSAKALAHYLKSFPEADNDQGCRVFKYGPRCSTTLLMPLFDHLDFSRFSMFPYGLTNDFSVVDHWGAGSCKCQKCMEGQICGHYVLHKNFHFYVYQDVAPATSTSPMIASKLSTTTISNGTSRFSFAKADWNLQFFRFRSRRLQTTIFAFDALVYQNYESEIKLRSSPLDYILSQLDVILSNWDSLLNASSQFLSSFRVEVLEERLETDRSIIRNLLVAAQHWEEFRRVLQVQLQRLEFLENVHGDPRWTEGRDNYFELLAIASGYLQRFRAIDYRIKTELMQETDSLVQRVTYLITIDEGYRSRDQNESIRRLTWITFIFLPMIFTAAIFSMQVDLFSHTLPWSYYTYTALVMMFIVFSGYALLRSRRRISRLLRSLAFRLLTKLTVSLPNPKKTPDSSETFTSDVEKQSFSSTVETSKVLKWAASSGRTDLVRNIIQSSSRKTKITPGMSGQALKMAIQNGHTEAAILLINNSEGLTYQDENNATVLHWAAKMGQSSIVRLLLEKGIHSEAKDQDDKTALDYAMLGEDELTINLLLKGGKNLTRQETANLQSLHFSARTGDIDMIKEFHNQGSSLEARDGKGQTVLFHAVKGKQHDIVKWLVQKGQANVQAVDKEGLTALHVAAQTCDVESAEILIEHNADVDARSSNNLTPLLCVPNSEGLRVLIFLREKGGDINAMDKNNERITHKAARKGDTASLLFKVACDLGADTNAAGSLGDTPAHVAAESGCIPILGVLYHKDSDLNKVRNTAGYTPLMTAARAGKVEAIRFLLEKGASYNAFDVEGRSLIELTIGWGNPEIISLLQEYGANYRDVNAAGGGPPPIWKAVYGGQSAASIATVLDGDVSIEYEYRGVRLLQLAIEVNNLELVRMLIERGATVDVPDMRGWTALHSAAFSGNLSLMLLILQKAKDQAPRDYQGWTPLDLAAFYKHDDNANTGPGK